MHTPLYRQALRESWELAWKHKLLWIFGFFAAFLGQMGLLELFSKIGLAGTRFAFFPKWLFLPEFFGLRFPFESLALPIDGWMWFLWLMIVFAGFGVLLVFVAVVSQGALVHATAQWVKKRKAPDADKAWHAGVGHFWRLLFLNLLKKVFLLALAVVLGFATVNVMLGVTVGNVILFVLLFILAVAVGMAVSFLAIYAAGYVVVEEYQFWRALESAWKLFLSHWLVSIEVGLILLFLNFVLGVVVLASFFVLFLPTLLLWMIAVSIASGTLYFVAMIIGLFFFLLFVVFLGSVFSVFTTASWTYLFMKMHREGIGSRVLHWLRIKS